MADTADMGRVDLRDVSADFSAMFPQNLHLL
jgi:hypothetical protein